MPRTDAESFTVLAELDTADRLASGQALRFAGERERITMVRQRANMFRPLWEAAWSAPALSTEPGGTPPDPEELAPALATVINLYPLLNSLRTAALAADLVATPPLLRLRYAAEAGTLTLGQRAALEMLGSLPDGDIPGGRTPKRAISPDTRKSSRHAPAFFPSKHVEQLAALYGFPEAYASAVGWLPTVRDLLVCGLLYPAGIDVAPPTAPGVTDEQVRHLCEVFEATLVEPDSIRREGLVLPPSEATDPPPPFEAGEALREVTPGPPVTLRWDPEGRTLWAVDAEGREVALRVYGGTAGKKANEPTAQAEVLSAFQAAGWPPAIEVPNAGAVATRRRWHAAARGITAGTAERVIIKPDGDSLTWKLSGETVRKN